jgi:hypothetical protein
MNLMGVMASFSIRQGFKSLVHSSSPLKWTKDIRFSRFQPTLAVSRGIDSTAGCCFREN